MDTNKPDMQAAPTIIMAGKIKTTDAMVNALNTIKDVSGRIILVADDVIATTALDVIDFKLKGEVVVMSPSEYEETIAKSIDRQKRQAEMIAELKRIATPIDPYLSTTNWGRCYAKDYKKTTSYASLRRKAKARRKSKTK